MSAMKTLFVVAILLAVLYGVHQYLNSPMSSDSPDEMADDWNPGLKIDTGTVAGGDSKSTAPRWNGEPSGTAPPFQPASATEPISSNPPAPMAPPAPLMPSPPDASAGAWPSATPPREGGPTAVSPDEATELAKAAGFGEASPYGTPAASNPAASNSAATNSAATPPYTPSPYTPGPYTPSPYTPGPGTPGSGDTDGANPYGAPPSAPPTPDPYAQPSPDPYSPTSPPSPADPYGTPPANPNDAPANPYDAPATDVPLGSREDYDAFMGRVSRSLAAERLAEAHLLLSQRYRDPATSADEARRMEPLLDQLAGTVIYSPESYLEAPYEVIPTDTLESIANRYNVPPSLLVKINGLDPNVPLRPGQRIKVVRGPFEAIIDASRQELTLMLGGERYAGRFPIALGPDMRQEGSLMVTDKDPTHWRGTRWIGLGQHMGMHEAIEPIAPGQPLAEGCIGLNRRDIDDLYDILAVGSKVTIRR